METIKVNMTPCEDIKTIHASQNDNEAREWGFELHNNGEKIDSSSISDQLVFKAYEGGTEEILPTNGSTPTTSPFKGDIKYPQGLLSDQEFLYRESPTEEDGLAKITNIKGNTLVWNQLVQNGNFADTSNWYVRGSATIGSASNNVLTFTASAQGDGVYSNVSMVQTHKYLYAFEYQSSEQITFNISGQSTTNYDASSTFKRASAVIKWNANTGTWQLRVLSNATSNFSDIKLRNCNLIDLTQMFGSGNEPSIVDEFTSLFPLSYYDFNQGTLIPFNGNGIKTTANLLETSKLEIGKNWTYGSASNCAIWQFDCQPETEYHIDLSYSSAINDAVMVYKSGYNTNQLSNVRVGTQKSVDITTPSGCYVVCIQFESGTSTMTTYDIHSQCRAYLKGNESTTSLPISTYFPTGMKSAGNVYDELTENKASERVGSMTLDGSQSASVSIVGSYTRLSVVHGASNVKYPNAQQESNYLPYLVSFAEKSNHFYANDSQAILIMQSSIVGTTVDSFNTYLQSHPLTIYYELATETETDIESASLVTENAEIPLSNEDGVLIGKCTEELSSNSGFFDAKIKLADEDGDVYSNKIQIHVERKPS